MFTVRDPHRLWWALEKPAVGGGRLLSDRDAGPTYRPSRLGSHLPTPAVNWHGPRRRRECTALVPHFRPETSGDTRSPAKTGRRAPVRASWRGVPRLPPARGGSGCWHRGNRNPLPAIGPEPLSRAAGAWSIEPPEFGQISPT